MRATLHHVQDETANIKTFWFEPERTLQFTAGQFTELTLHHPHPDDRGQKRWFTLSSSPTSLPLVSITTKFAGKDSSSFKKAFFRLQPGEPVDLADAMGDFVLPKLVQTPLIFVAGGIGLTPFHSMATWLFDTGERRNVRFLYAVKREEDIVFTETFNKAGIDPTIVVGDPSPSWGGERGHLSAELILGLEPPTDDTLIYISGPEQMVEGLQSDLEKKGIKSRQLVGDFFPGYASY